MKSAILASAVLAGVASATTSLQVTSTACSAATVVEACLGTENALFSSCGENDWDCKCNAQQQIVTCYNNCPNDPRKFTAEGQVSIFCGYASQYPSSTTAAAKKTTAAATATGTAASAAASDGAVAAGASGSTGTATATATKTTATGSSDSDSSGSSSGSAASSTATGNAAAGSAPVHYVGGILAAAAGLVAALL